MINFLPINPSRPAQQISGSHSLTAIAIHLQKEALPSTLPSPCYSCVQGQMSSDLGSPPGAP